MTPVQARAKAELDKMRASLAGWLRVRDQVNAVTAGTMTAAYPAAVAKQIFDAYRDQATETKLALELRAFISQAYDSSQINVESLNAEELARFVVTGRVPEGASTGPSPQGFFPLLILIAGIAYIATSAIGNYADILKERDRLALCKADPGNSECGVGWWKYVAIGGVVYFLWRETSLLDPVKELLGTVKSKAARSRAGR
jgi:hypothetical protein